MVLVSEDRKLAFVHIQKTGGSTLDRLLRAHVHDMRMVGQSRHEFALRGARELPNWDEYFRFAFVRNPWSRLVSWYSMVTKFRRSGNELWRYVRDNSSNFEEFIRFCTDEVKISEGVYYSFAYNQLDYVTDENGALLVDFIGRLENFDEDVQKVFGRFGIEVETVPHRNRSRHTHYSAFYTPELEEIVRERFKRDIDHFGYEFERVSAPELATQLHARAPQDAEKKAKVQKNRGRRRRGKPGLLFVCGCDRSGTTTFADYLNKHPEVLVCQERFKATIPQEKIRPDLFTFDRIGEFRPGETENPIWKNGKEYFVTYHKLLLAHKNERKLRWIGDKNPNYVRRPELIASNNPGARFIVMYRPIEEVAESWEARASDPEDHWNDNRGFESAVRTWNLALRNTRRFVENSVAPRALLVNYHDFFERTEKVAPLISGFLNLELDDSVTEAWAEKSREFSNSRRPKKALSPEQQAYVRGHADREAEAWFLDRVEQQWTRPDLYVQDDAIPALTATMNAMEARAWRLQRRADDLEQRLARQRREADELASSRSFKLLNRINGIRQGLQSRVTGKK